MSAAEAYEVTVLLRCEQRQRGRWSFPVWSLSGLLPGRVGDARGQVHDQDGTREYIWPGLSIRLLASRAETYWFNLGSTDPSVFVVCREDPVYGLMPLSVTLDQDEASRQIEGDGEVFRAPVPEGLLRRLETFVMDHYTPSERRRKRRRKPNDQAAE